MSRKKTGLIYAVDQSFYNPKTREFLESIAPYVDYYKVGLEAMTAIDRATGRSVAVEVLDICDAMQKRVMWDMKLLDVKNTVQKAVFNIVRYAEMFTLHAQPSDETLEAAAEIAKRYAVTALAVTVLTDLDDEQCISRFGNNARTTVIHFATEAYEKGIRGFVCSAKEARIIREELPDGSQVAIVTPAIRPVWYGTPDEQRRATTPTQAVQAGADYIVVGRPIGSVDDARRIREELDAA